MATRRVVPPIGTKCIECGKPIGLRDKYESVQKSRTMGGGRIFIHTECYQKRFNQRRTK